MDDEALWHPVIGEESTAVTSALQADLPAESAPAPEVEREKPKQQWGFWAALSAGFSVAEDWVS